MHFNEPEPLSPLACNRAVSAEEAEGFAVAPHDSECGMDVASTLGYIFGRRDSELTELSFEALPSRRLSSTIEPQRATLPIAQRHSSVLLHSEVQGSGAAATVNRTENHAGHGRYLNARCTAEPTVPSVATMNRECTEAAQELCSELDLQHMQQVVSQHEAESAKLKATTELKACRCLSKLKATTERIAVAVDRITGVPSASRDPGDPEHMLDAIERAFSCAMRDVTELRRSSEDGSRP